MLVELDVHMFNAPLCYCNRDILNCFSTGRCVNKMVRMHELYIDTKKQCYKDLGFKRLNIFSGIGAIFAKTTRDGLAKAKEQNIDGNMKGDGFQNGGALVVKAGGKEVIYSYKQEDPGLYVQPNDILKALGLEETKEAPKVEEASGGG